ncbi:MAG: hypothetical protein N2505_06715, partial [Endomicrobia bacterium]|nr:hypothetical protein [Endomicrobiia bacterium]
MRKKLIFFIMPIIVFCIVLNYYLFGILLTKYNISPSTNVFEFRFDFVQYALASFIITLIFTAILVIFKLDFIIDPIKELTSTATK